MAHLKAVDLPSFGGSSDVLPELPLAEYKQRLAALQAQMRTAGYDVLVVYADREHAANIAFVTGFDPRFEEALLLLDQRGNRQLLVGNECMGYLPNEELRCEVVLFQEFSLMGQPRDRSQALRQTFSEFGVRAGTNVGCVGWKYFEESRMKDAQHAIEIPAYLVDLLRDITGGPATVRNANPLLMNPSDGLRLFNSADQIAHFEFAAIKTSESILSVMRHIREGAQERELQQHMDSAGLVCSCHPMVSFGQKVKRGLSSPSANRARLGDPYSIAFGIAGSLTCRAGAVAREAADLPADVRSFYPRLASNYFEVITRYYEALRVGAQAGQVFDAVERTRDPQLYSLPLNPGHYIHLDEWLHSPFCAGSEIQLRSGMALQVDIIPVSQGPFCYSNAEDGVALADKKLRSEIAARHPAAWQRIQARQTFMREQLGIRLDESVLPLGNIPAWLPPYVLNLEQAFVAG